MSKSFGDGVPYGDPLWYSDGSYSPYYNDSHRAFRAKCRDFVENEVTPFVDEWEAKKSIPNEVNQKAAKLGLLPCIVGKNGYEVAGITPPENYDTFHELIFIDELARCCSGGVLWGLIEGIQIGLPPVLNHASPEMVKRVGKECLNGDKVICLCITEPTAGSDVANIKATAKLTPDGKHYIVSGEKKWITNGIFADYFSVAVRTGGPGMGGISMLLIEKTMPGVNCRRMDCQGVHASGTTYIEFRNVKVPVGNLIGKENAGFKVIMTNFNHERWGFVVQCNRFSRMLVEESMKYAKKRRTFGKPLVDHPVIRWKLAEMIRQVESTHNWLENVTYQMEKLPAEEAGTKLGGVCALMKAHSTKVMEYCAREASQIFGGNSYTKTGMGAKVERLYRDVRAYAIPGGSEEILLDLSVRQAYKEWGKPKKSSL